MLDLFKVLADSTRLRLLRILHQGDFTVQDLMQILDMGQSRISRHLKIMIGVGLLQIEKQGTWHYYRLSFDDGLFNEFWPLINSHLTELECQDCDHLGVLRVMSARRQRSQEFFDRHARNWDNMHITLLNLPDYQDLLFDMIPSGGLIVEVGVGSGHLLPLLSQRGEMVLGLDHSPSMVSLARETVAQHQLTGKVEVRLAEMNHLPCIDHTVRTIVLNQVLHHAEHPVEVFKEVSRVLVSGGSLIIADLARHEHDWARERLADQWLGFNRDELEKWLNESGLALSLCQEINAKNGQQTVLLLKADNRNQ